MKVTVQRPVEIEIKTLRIIVPVRHADEDMPYEFPGRIGDSWDILIDVDTGKIKDWPNGLSYDLFMKVTDGGLYYLCDAEGVQCGSLEEEYVPHGIVPGEYGDYIHLQIAADGAIMNWPDKPNVSEFCYGQS